MNTPAPSLHPIMALALRAARPVTQRLKYGNVTYIDAQHMRDEIERDRKALDAQMQSENLRTNFGETI